MSVQRSSVDWLTGLPSMARFHELATEGAAAIRAQGEQPVAAALDLVGMKSYNTQYGREQGDVLLCMFADILAKHFGEEACSRFAEDHYYAFIPSSKADEAFEKLFDEFKKANSGQVLPVRVGAYVCDPEDDIVAVGFDRAKIACDLDRKTWESRVTWFNDDMRAAAKLRIHVLDRVDQAIDSGWVCPYYQAIVRSATGNVCGEEALARWIDPEYGELHPDQFIPVLEEAGLLQKLDIHILDCVIADMASKRLEGVPIVPVSINISLRDLGRLNVAEEVSRKADAAGLPHHLLRIEFTESASFGEPELFRSQVDDLREQGFQVWMDDFGSGYSSLNTLQEYSFDLIKLDMDFIRDIHNEKANDIVAGVVQVAKKLGVGTLAEGVETEEQALFLESVGCDMLQGFFYTRPMPLDDVTSRAHNGLGMARENPSEASYWNAVGAVDLIDPVAKAGGGHSVDGTPISDFPAGVLENRNGVWNVLRANRSLREFFDKSGVLPLSRSSLQANPIETEIDEEFYTATMRSNESGMWERISGHLEYGTGLQFYVKRIASSPEASAYALAAVPTMLGTALGSYGDVPVAYAVLRVRLNAAGNAIADADYVFANSVYCEWSGFEVGSLTGRSFLELHENARSEWFPYCFRAVVLGESVQETVYNPTLGHWLSFSMAPSPVEGCCVFAYTFADEEQREREAILVGRDTSDLIIDIAKVFSAERSYDAAMNAVLEMVSQIVHPSRLIVFERGKGSDWITFEWCAQGVTPQAGSPQSASDEAMNAWDALASAGSVIHLPDISVLRESDRNLYEHLRKQGISRMLAAPLYDGGTIVGYLVAEDYDFEKGIDAMRLLEAVGTFMSSRIVNQRLLAELERAGTHDVLTGLLNRRGFDNALAERMNAKPGEPFVLALMDIDDFKTVNDLHGHDVGDAALRALASAVTEALPDGVILGRNGGDEFVAALFGADATCADEVFAAFSATERGCEHDGKWYRLSMSIGYAGCPDQASSLNDAYTKADAALYAVKLAGKSGFKRYSPDVESQYRSQLGFTPRDIAENIPAAILVHRAGGEGEILFANDEIVDMFECESLADFMDYTGGVFANIVHPDDASRVYEELVEQISLDDIGAKNFANYRIITKKGNVRHVADNGRLIEVDEVGKIFYVLIVDRDERLSDKDSPLED